MRYYDISVEDLEEIRVVRLNRPTALNSIRHRTVEELDDALAAFTHASNPHALIITGTGADAFCAGGDIKEMQRIGVADARSFAALAHKVVRTIEQTSKPVVSAVNGLALGAGCDLALACDICLASDSAKFGMPSLNVGVISPFGGMSRLAMRVGLSRAKSLIFTGSLLDAKEALAIGLVNEVHTPGNLMHGSIELTRRLLAKAPIAFALSKKLLERNADLSRADALEIEYYARCFGTKDQKEGASAFAKKRAPVFTGK